MTPVFRRLTKGDSFTTPVRRVAANLAMTLSAGAWLFAAAHPAFAGHWELSNPTMSGSLTKQGVFYDPATETEDWQDVTLPWSDAYQWNAYYESWDGADDAQICRISGSGQISVTATWVHSNSAHPELDPAPAKVVAYAWYRAFYNCYNTGDGSNWADDGWGSTLSGSIPVYASSESYHAIHADGSSGTFTITSPTMSVNAMDDVFTDISVSMYLGDFDSPDIAVDSKIWDKSTGIQGGTLATPASVTINVGTDTYVHVNTATDQDTWSTTDLYSTVIDSGTENDTMHYHWSGPGLNADGVDAIWTAPSTPGDYTLTCTIDDTGTAVAPDSGNRNDDPIVRTVTVHVLPW